MWQKLLEGSSYPYSENINYYLDAQSDLYPEPITPIKFALAGQCFLDLALKLERDSDRWLKNWQNASYGESECVVAHDWCDWLANRTQQSVSVAFLDKYRLSQREPNNYPDNRASVVVETVLEAPEIEDLDLLIATAYTEEIQAWSSLISSCLSRGQAISFQELIAKIDLSPAKIYLGILLSDRFSLTGNSDDFYGGFWVRLD
ncbi:hypothetical protein NIES4102_39790 (plasmid) [Chondrocystis sp. NIES-4102]|nr:hypothetical protein NIES4102_39790 [Chondrocystis sp. NIES-4102]